MTKTKRNDNMWPERNENDRNLCNEKIKDKHERGILKMAEIKKMGYWVNGEWKESKAEKYMDVTDPVQVR